MPCTHLIWYNTACRTGPSWPLVCLNVVHCILHGQRLKFDTDFARASEVRSCPAELVVPWAVSSPGPCVHITRLRRTALHLYNVRVSVWWRNLCSILHLASPPRPTCHIIVCLHVCRFLEAQFVPWLFIIKPYLTYQLGGIGLVAWALAVPLVTGWHSTFLVNSAAHVWGRRPYETGVCLCWASLSLASTSCRGT